MIVKSSAIQPHYTLIDKSGNQLRFPNDQVEFVSDSLLEVYAYRRATQIRNNAPACLALAQWCMQTRLFDQAQEQIDNAISIAGRTTTSTRLEVRLDLLRLPPTGHALQSTGTTASPQIISADQVRQRIDQFPDGVVRQFIRSVQPLLLNRCALASCHGPSPKSGFVLFRTTSTRPIPHRVSQRNLYNTLATLDLLQPENSSLLTAATTVHGGQKQPALNIDASHAIGHLVNWVRIVASTPAHNINSISSEPPLTQGPILYQHVDPQRTEKMQTPDSKLPAKIRNAPVVPNKLQQWMQSRQPQQTQSALGLGVVLPVEMQGPTFGSMKISPTQRVNLTPEIGGNFSFPSERKFLQTGNPK
ncbi:MAG: hypothetical protein VX761_01175 [Planctomycetota bacterium]|nr:hypothetical protein [Planctomycetota bacterium]